MKRTEDEMKTHVCFSHCLRQIREMAGKRSVGGSTSLPIDLLSGKRSSQTAGDVVNMNVAKKEAMIPPIALCGGSQEDETQKRTEYRSLETRCWSSTG